MLKRFQYLTKDGAKWTPWFETKETPIKWQLKSYNLKNEYKDV